MEFTVFLNVLSIIFQNACSKYHDIFQNGPNLPESLLNVSRFVKYN